MLCGMDARMIVDYAVVFCFFCLMIRRPPRSTLLTHSFPTRRSSDLLALLHSLGCPVVLGASRKRTIGALSNEAPADQRLGGRSEEHTSELQSLMRISYAVFCLKKKNKYKREPTLQYCNATSIS